MPVGAILLFNSNDSSGEREVGKLIEEIGLAPISTPLYNRNLMAHEAQETLSNCLPQSIFQQSNYLR